MQITTTLIIAPSYSLFRLFPTLLAWVEGYVAQGKHYFAFATDASFLQAEVRYRKGQHQMSEAFLPTTSHASAIYSITVWAHEGKDHVRFRDERQVCKVLIAETNVTRPWPCQQDVRARQHCLESVPDKHSEHMSDGQDKIKRDSDVEHEHSSPWLETFHIDCHYCKVCKLHVYYLQFKHGLDTLDGHQQASCPLCYIAPLQAHVWEICFADQLLPSPVGPFPGFIRLDFRHTFLKSQPKVKIQ